MSSDRERTIGKIQRLHAFASDDRANPHERENARKLYEAARKNHPDITDADLGLGPAAPKPPDIKHVPNTARVSTDDNGRVRIDDIPIDDMGVEDLFSVIFGRVGRQDQKGSDGKTRTTYTFNMDGDEPPKTAQEAKDRARTFWEDMFQTVTKDRFDSGYWTTETGQRLKIADMTDSHLIRATNHLYSRRMIVKQIGETVAGKAELDYLNMKIAEMEGEKRKRRIGVDPFK